jgi:hypothetical protein
MSRTALALAAVALLAAACTPAESSPADTTSTTTIAAVTTLPPTSPTTTSTTLPPETTTTTTALPENECEVGSSTNVEGYTQGCTVLGLEILAGEEVDPEAVSGMADRVYNMLVHRADYAPSIAAYPIGLRIISDNQRIMDLPEFEDIYFHHPGIDWRYLGRSFPGTEEIPFAAGAEENLLCSTEDRYEGEDNFLRDFAITMRRFAMDVVDETTSIAIEQAYAVAIAEGKYVNTLAEINSEQYWAEGVQSFFDANLEDNAEDREPLSSHNHVNTRYELREYDRALYEIAISVFGDTEWRPGCSA